MIEHDLTKICDNPLVRCGSGANDTDIEDAEKSLNVIFPYQLKVFLTKIGWIEIGPDEIYGLGANIPEHLNIVTNTKGERYEVENPLPSKLIPIMNDGMGNHYCLIDNDKCSKVVFWDYFLEEIEEIEQKDLVSFLESRVSFRSE